MGEYGRIDSVTDRRLNVFSFVYSEETGGLNAGNVSSVTAPAGPNSAPARVTSYTYDAYDRVTEVEDHGTHTGPCRNEGVSRGAEAPDGVQVNLLLILIGMKPKTRANQAVTQVAIA